MNVFQLVCNFSSSDEEDNSEGENDTIHFEKKKKLLKEIRIYGETNKNEWKILLGESLKTVYFSIENNKGEMNEILNDAKFPNLVYLSLKNTLINENLNFFKMNKLKMLQNLILVKNRIKSLKFLKNFESKNLMTLDVSFTKIEILEGDVFESFKNMKKLIISNLNIKIIEKFDKFRVESLILNKSRMNLMDFNENFIKNVSELKRIIGEESYIICCMAKEYVDENVECELNMGFFSSCHRLISQFSTRIIHWIFGIFGFIINSISFILSFTSKNHTKFFRIFLNLDDLIISSYILSLAVIDTIFAAKVDFLKSLINWLKSPLCDVFENLVTFSLVSSSGLFFLLVLSLYLMVINPFKKSILAKRPLIVILVFLFFTFLLSFWKLFTEVIKNICYFFFSIDYL